MSPGFSDTLVADLKAGHAAVSTAAGLVVKDYLVAGERIRLRVAGASLLRYIRPLDHLSVPAVGDPDLTLSLYEAPASAKEAPASPWHESDYLPRGEIDGTHGGRLHVAYAMWGALSLLDVEAGSGHLWVRELSAVPGFERAAPLRTLLFWWLESRALTPIHASAIGIDGSGVLLVGPSGSGKSTAVIAALRFGLDVAGDDYVAVGFGDNLVAHGLYCAARLNDEQTPPGWKALELEGSKGWDDKHTVLLDETFPGKVVPSLELAGIVEVRAVPGSESSATSASPAQIFRALAPSTLMQSPLAGSETFRRCAELAKQLPGHRLDLGNSEATAVRVLKSLL